MQSVSPIAPTNTMRPLATSNADVEVAQEQQNTAPEIDRYGSERQECVIYMCAASAMPSSINGVNITPAVEQAHGLNPYTAMLMMPYREGRSPMTLLASEVNPEDGFISEIAWEAADGKLEHIRLGQADCAMLLEQIQADGLVVGFVPEDEQGLIYDLLVMPEVMVQMYEQQMLENQQ